MEEYISREAAIKEVYTFDGYLDDDLKWRLHYALKKLPAADVVEVRHGWWIDRPSKRGYGMSTYCSCCGQHSGIGGIESNRHRAYCPNCGAKMDGGQDDV